MDLNLIFWTAAWLNMLVLTGFALSGVRQIRKGQVARHKRSMLTAASLVVAFLVAYGLKLAFLGREDLLVWSTPTIYLLRFHELCVAGMLVFGSLALYRGFQLARTRLLSEAADAPDPQPGQRTRHRRVGRMALVAMVFATLSAGGVLAGMYSRLG
ncbi:MAG: DUF420 domain-containing protein [Myxococcota bacterium]